MTYKYINPETDKPTKVPPAHYEKILDQVTEKYMADITSRQFLTIMYNQLNGLKKEDEKYFQQALICIDLGLNPKDLRIDEQIALEYTNEFLNERKQVLKKDNHILDQSIIDFYNDTKENPDIQSHAVKESNKLEGLNKSNKDMER